MYRLTSITLPLLSQVLASWAVVKAAVRHAFVIVKLAFVRHSELFRKYSVWLTGLPQVILELTSN